jgi:hypothetical protein
MSERKIFSVCHLVIKLTSRDFLLTAFTSVFTAYCLIQDGDHDWLHTLVAGDLILTGLYIFGSKALDFLAGLVDGLKLKANVGGNTVELIAPDKPEGKNDRCKEKEDEHEEADMGER